MNEQEFKTIIEQQRGKHIAVVQVNLENLINSYNALISFDSQLIERLQKESTINKANKTK